MHGTRTVWAVVVVTALAGIMAAAADSTARGIPLGDVSEIGTPGFSGAVRPPGDDAFAVVAEGSGDGQQVVVGEAPHQSLHAGRALEALQEYAAVDARGVPAAVRSMTGLPEPPSRSLQAWRPQAG